MLTTAPKREFQVARWLEEERGAYTLVPLIHRWRTSKRHGPSRNLQRVKTELPLIPRIVVVGLASPPQASELSRSYRHITGVLGIAGSPAAMRPGEVERLRETSVGLLQPRNPARFKAGDRVRMPVPGYGGEHVIVEISSLTGKWAKVKQSWFGAEREVPVEVDKLEAA